MRNTIGYARSSPDDPECVHQQEKLWAAGARVVRSEPRVGSRTWGRTELEAILTFIRDGDTLLVTRLDRLTGSLAEMDRIMRGLKDKGAELKVLEQPIDTAAEGGEAFVRNLRHFAEFERSIRRERQMAGIARAKKRGAYKGRKPSVPVEEVKRLKAEGVSPTRIARLLGIGRSSVYRALDAR